MAASAQSNSNAVPPTDEPATKLSRPWQVMLAISVPAIYLGIPALILIDLIPFDQKFVALTVGGALVYILFRLAGYSNRSLGITSRDAARSIMRVLPLTILLAGAALVLYTTGYSRIDPTEDWAFFLFYVFISCPIQEFLYRGALPALANTVQLPYVAAMLATSLMYSLVHVIYLDPLTLVATFLIGLYWYWSYKGAPTLIGVSASHAVLGVVTIAVGLVD